MALEASHGSWRELQEILVVAERERKLAITFQRVFRGVESSRPVSWIDMERIWAPGVGKLCI